MPPRARGVRYERTERRLAPVLVTPQMQGVVNRRAMRGADVARALAPKSKRKKIGPRLAASISVRPGPFVKLRRYPFPRVSARVLVDVPYGRFPEFGTSKQDAQRYLREAAAAINDRKGRRT